MAVLSKEEILKALRSQIKEDTSDDTIQFIENVNDTIEDYEKKVKDTTDWQKKYTENDEQWRKKYRDRFFNTPDEPEKNEDPDEPDENKLTYENLFKEETK